MLRLAPGVVLLPGADAQAVKLLCELPQPFTTSEARSRLGTSRRVVLPLLEHLDRARLTRRFAGRPAPGAVGRFPRHACHLSEVEESARVGRLGVQACGRSHSGGATAPTSRCGAQLALEACRSATTRGQFCRVAVQTSAVDGGPVRGSGVHR